MNEIISGMRVIKMYTWEKPFAQLVAEIRRLMIEFLFTYYWHFLSFWTTCKSVIIHQDVGSINIHFLVQFLKTCNEARKNFALLDHIQEWTLAVHNICKESHLSIKLSCLPHSYWKQQVCKIMKSFGIHIKEKR